MTDPIPPSAVGDLVEAWLTARADRDLDRLGMLTASDAIWHKPVEGPQVGRSAVVNEVRRGFEKTDSFETTTLEIRCDAASAAAQIRNTATRGEKHLDSTQTLYLKTDRGVVSEVRIQVDDPTAVEEFWA